MSLQSSLQFSPQLKQQPQLSADMLHSLEILRMPLLELYTHLTTAVTENPMLEIAPPAFGEDEKSTCPVFTEPGIRQAPAAALYTGADDETPPSPLDSATEEETFFTMLKRQVHTLHLSKRFSRLCVYIIDCLDTRGYLADAPEDIARLLNRSKNEVMQALYLVQSLHPTGVGARSLEECLILQLAESPLFNSHTVALVKTGLPLLAENKVDSIALLLGCTFEEAAEACRVIRQLNPIPSRGFHCGGMPHFIVPDAAINCTKGQVLVTINEKYLPKVSLNPDYQRILKTTADDETKNYLRQKQTQAKHLIHAVTNRRQTLYHILKYAATYQQLFFTDGQTLLPMTMAETANELGLHPSTIGRAVNGKHIVCAAGIIPLKSLFTSCVGSSGQVSAMVIKKRIQEHIQKENPKMPLSDEALRSALSAEGIKVSRRGIAKYREEMGILSSIKRKAAYNV